LLAFEKIRHFAVVDVVGGAERTINTGSHALGGQQEYLPE
jgi:hypothetical protein